MKVKYGVNTQTWVGGFGPQDYPLVEKAAKLGFQVIEISYGENETVFDPKALKRLLDEHGLGVVMCGYIHPNRDITSTDPSLRAMGMKYFRNAAETAKILGAKVFAGPLYAEIFRGRWLPEDERKAEWDRSVKAQREAADICADAGLTIAMEPLNRFETDFINTAHQAVRYVEEVGKANVKVHLDTFHMCMEEKHFGSAIREAGKHLAHVHANSNDRGTPGEGHIPWSEVVTALKDVNYAGIVSIEGFAPYDKGLVEGGKIWRPVAKSQDQLAIDGLKFLKSVFA